MNGLNWVFKLHLRYPFKSLFVIIGQMIEVLLFTYPITITADVIGIVIEGSSLSQIQDKVLLLLGLAFVQAFIYFLLSFTNEILAHRVTTDITQELFETLQYRSLTYHDSKDVGEIMARATGDTRTINIALSPAVRMLVAIFMLWIVNLINAFTVNLFLGFLGILMFIIFFISGFKYSNDLVPYSRATRENFASLTKDVDNYITGIREIKGFVSEPWVKRKFIKQSIQLQKAEITEGRKGAWFYPLLATILFAGAMIVLSLYFAYSPNIDVTIRQAIRISGFATFLIGISQEMSWSLEFLVRARAGANRIYNIIQEADPAQFKAGDLDLTKENPTIEFRNVSFRYRDDLPLAITNISFKVKKNQTVAIVGGPGSGKSTLTKLVQRLYLPTSGEVLLGDYPIEKYSNESLRKTIATVEQDIYLFNKSVKENIRFGKPEASDEEVIQAAKLAEAHDFIMGMPDQYENLIGEKGVRLSGGQAQRLSIARALLVDPAILIMDDGASALDAKTEIKIQEAISSILQTHTTLITTHRLSIISKADVVIILDKGNLVGMGTHEDLIRTNPYYRRLFEHHYKLPPLNIEQSPIQEVSK